MIARALNKLVGPRRVEQARLWVGPAGRYFASVAIIGLFLTEWSAVVNKIPYYNYKKEEN